MTNDGTQDHVSARLDFDQHAGTFTVAMARLDRAATRLLDDAAVDHRLRELVRIRASQINGCAYCIDMHTRDAREIGETEQRIYALAAWRETPFFTARERAALTFTEAVTRLATDHLTNAEYEGIAAHFDAQEVVALLSAIVTVNAWNALAVSTRTWLPGSYDPRSSSDAADP